MKLRRRRSALREVDTGVLREAAQVLGPDFHGQRGRMAQAFLLTLAGTAVELARPWPLKLLFDEVLVPPETGGGGLFGWSPHVTVAALGAAVFLAAALGSHLQMRATLAAAEVSRKVTTRVRRRIFEHLHRLELPFHSSSTTGDLLVRLTGDVNLARDAMFTTWLTLSERGLLMVGMVVVLGLVDPLLALVALLPLPLLALQLRRSGRELRSVVRKQRRRMGSASGFAAESLRQVAVVKAFVKEGDAARAYAEQTGTGEKANLKAAKIAAAMGRKTETVSGLGLGLVVMVGGWAALDGRMSPGDFVLATSYARSLYKPLRKVSKEGGRLSKATAGLERILEVLRIPPEPAGVGERVDRLDGDIELRSVSFAFDDGRRALDQLSFHVRPGQLALITGPNGAGKTTTIDVLFRFLQPDEGEVLVDGRPVTDYELHAYRRCFAYVPQDLLLFGTTVRENLVYGRPDATDDEVAAAAAQAMFDEVVERMPDGYDTLLGEDGASLSGGEARRLMLARAALQGGSVVVLDEPFAGLDPDARPLVANAIRSIAAGRTVIVVSHVAASDLDPDLVIPLRRGRRAPTSRARKRAGGVRRR